MFSWFLSFVGMMVLFRLQLREQNHVADAFLAEQHHGRPFRPGALLRLKSGDLGLGFAGVMSGPLVRSSYRAGRLYRQAMDRQAAGAPQPP